MKVVIKVVYGLVRINCIYFCFHEQPDGRDEGKSMLYYK